MIFKHEIRDNNFSAFGLLSMQRNTCHMPPIFTDVSQILRIYFLQLSSSLWVVI